MCSLNQDSNWTCFFGGWSESLGPLLSMSLSRPHPFMALRPPVCLEGALLMSHAPAEGGNLVRFGP